MKTTNPIIVLGTVAEEKPRILVVVDFSLVSLGYDAKKIAQDLAVIIKGGGGGRPEMAQAGGSDPTKLQQALSAVPKMIQKIGESG